jgi:hypothetical protein
MGHLFVLWPSCRRSLRGMAPTTRVVVRAKLLTEHDRQGTVTPNEGGKMLERRLDG